jgi:ABC-type multidrug transport system permease subunit
MLTSRYTKIMVRDRKNLLLLLAQAPAIAVFLCFVFKSDAKFLPMSFYFCLTISAIWMSGINAAQEIAREWPLLDREHRVGLSLKAFLIAKAAMTAQSALIQATLFWLFMGVLFKTFPFSFETWILIVTGAASGGILGLSISALSGSVGRAITVLPMIFIPQIFFSGILIPFDRMTAIGRVLSYCTFSRPVFSLFKHTCLLEQPLFQSDAWPGLCFLMFGLIILIAVAVRWNLLKIHHTR